MKIQIKKFNNGDSLSNNDIDDLINHYSALEELLREHGQILHLSWRYIWDKLEILKSYKRAREK